MRSKFIGLPWRAVLLSLLWVRPAISQCILQPTDPGQNGQTRSQNFLALVHDLYANDFHPTHRVVVNGKTLQAPPWYSSSTDCDVPHLQGNNGMIASPSFSDYLVVSDELSELAGSPRSPGARSPAALRTRRPTPPPASAWPTTTRPTTRASRLLPGLSIAARATLSRRGISRSSTRTAASRARSPAPRSVTGWQAAPTPPRLESAVSRCGSATSRTWRGS
jgi:hypothetical protein